MPKDDSGGKSSSPDHTFDPATLYATLPKPAALREPAPPRRMGPFARQLALAAVAAGLILLGIGAWQHARSAGTRGWIETRARIVSAQIRASAGGDYRLDVSYHYRAGPREREGSRVALHPDLSRDGAYAYAARFRPGAVVPAWFDPASPDSSVLERAAGSGGGAASWSGALLLVMGAAPFGWWLASATMYRFELRQYKAAARIRGGGS